MLTAVETLYVKVRLRANLTFVDHTLQHGDATRRSGASGRDESDVLRTQWDLRCQ